MFRAAVLLAILTAPVLAFVFAPGVPPSKMDFRPFVILDAYTERLENRRVEQIHNRLVATVEKWREELACVEIGGAEELADQLRRRIAVTEADIAAYHRGSWGEDSGLVAPVTP